MLPAATAAAAATTTAAVIVLSSTVSLWHLKFHIDTFSVKRI